MPEWTPPASLRWTCDLCGREMVGSIEDAADHLRDEHGMESERWPDGQLVVDDSAVVKPHHFAEPREDTDGPG